jgi:hypothetical protein
MFSRISPVTLELSQACVPCNWVVVCALHPVTAMVQYALSMPFLATSMLDSRLRWGSWLWVA